VERCPAGARRAPELAPCAASLAALTVGLMPGSAPDSTPSGGGRPSVSLVVPFRDSAEQLDELLAALAAVRLAPADEVVIADNTPTGVTASRGLTPPWRAVPASCEASTARARNAGAGAAAGDWLLFVDADCRPDPGVVDAYLAEPLGAECGIVAGAVRADPSQRSIAATWARTRGLLDERHSLADPFLPYPVMANVLVRRAAWRELGGFLEGIANGEDVDFSWRAQRAGWKLAYRPEARVTHAHRATVGALLRQAGGHAAGEGWVRRRWGLGAAPARPHVQAVARAALAAPAFLATGQVARARLKALDAAVAVARQRGAGMSNRARRPAPVPGSERPLQLWCDAFPVLSETFVVNEARALMALGHEVTVVAWRRPERPAPAAHDVAARWAEDDTPRERRRALGRLLLRHPWRCAADLVGRATWRRGEDVTPLRMLAPEVLAVDPARHPVLHAHFARGAALDALRAARLAGVPWTLTAHAHDIYARPENLAIKVRDAGVVTSGCDRTVEDLRAIAGQRTARHVVKVVMGVDVQRFHRARPVGSSRTVLAVGRLVEKKGFGHLLAAVARPELRDVAQRVVIAGDGPLRGELERLVRDLGVRELVELPGACDPDDVRALLEDCAVLAVPSVIAADGDRDSMPVVAKEALAMEVPIVCSDLMGLPEVARHAWGRLVPPGDPAALAAALREILLLDVAVRAEMGRAGREFVRTFADVHVETARLAKLLSGLAPRG
jgi:colanic acid/amylovoran biosynthesis glycosyltransferase